MGRSAGGRGGLDGIGKDAGPVIDSALSIPWHAVSREPLSRLAN